MAAPLCLGSIGFCALRVTALDDTGAPDTDYYITDKSISLGLTTVISEGQDREVRNGCDCPIAFDKAEDVLKRFTFELAEGVVEPALLALLLGQDPILDPDTPTSVIGVNFRSDQLCGKPFVALEAWSKTSDLDHPNPTFPYWHWRWPATQWQLGANTLNADFLQPALTGFSRGNTEFGDPYNDLPADGTLVIDSDFFSFWMADDFPTAACGLQTLTP